MRMHRCRRAWSRPTPNAREVLVVMTWTMMLQGSFASATTKWTALGASLDQISFDGTSLCGVFKQKISCARMDTPSSQPKWIPQDGEMNYVTVAGDYAWAVGLKGDVYVNEWTRLPSNWSLLTNGRAVHVASDGATLCQDSPDAGLSCSTFDFTTEKPKLMQVPDSSMLTLDLRLRKDDVYALNASGYVLHRNLSSILSTSWNAVGGPLRRVALDGSGLLCGVTIDLTVVCATNDVTSDAPEWKLIDGISAIDVDVGNGQLVVVTPERKLYKSTFLDLESAPAYELTSTQQSSSLLMKKSAAADYQKWTLVVLMSLAGVLLCVIVGLLCDRHRKALLPPDDERAADKFMEIYERTVTPSHSSQSIAPELLQRLAREPGIRAIRLDCTDLTLITNISAVAHGEVWKGKYSGNKVAVKPLRFGQQKQQELVLQFAEEIKTMATLSHPRIVGFYGVCWSSTIPLSAVMEYMNAGDVRSMLDEDPEKLDWRAGTQSKLGIAVAVAEALVYLHMQQQPPLIHRDVKSRNVLLDTVNGAKLGDFGCSKTALMGSTMTTAIDSAAYWAAPEVLRGDRYSELADVYSLGVLVWELATGAVPYSFVLNSQGKPSEIIHGVATGRLRLSFHADNISKTVWYPEAIAEVAMKCLSYDPSKRPSAEAALASLRLC